MALHPIGSNKNLIEIRTEFVDVIVKERKKSPVPSYRLNGEIETEIKVVGSELKSLVVRGEPVRVSQEATQDGIMTSCKTSPVFYEQVIYEIIIKGAQGERLGFWHENPSLRQQITPLTEAEDILTGIINFDNSIGFSDFIILRDGQVYLRICLEVFPSKIDYRRDYQELLWDITKEAQEAVFDFLKKTYGLHELGDMGAYSPGIFFTILQTIYKDFVRAVDQVIEDPNHILTRERELISANKAKKIDKNTVKWARKHPSYGNPPSHVLAEKKNITFHTFENKFVKYVLEEINRKLEDFYKIYVHMRGEGNAPFLKGIKEMEVGIRRRISQSFLANVKHLEQEIQPSLVLEMAPGYREVYRYYLMLQRCLTLQGEVFKISAKDTALLYEYWCFIKLNSILKKKYQLDSPDIIKIDNRGITVSLVKGKRSELRYKNPKTGEKFSLVYNPGIQSTQTVSQKPDGILSLKKSGSNVIYRYIFDAKYRIGFSEEGVVGPKEEDINTMHRYRDAIVYENTKLTPNVFEKTMFGAYVLFPYAREEEYKEHPFYKSISTVNIGGLPFLPGTTRLVEQVLTELIEDSEQTAFERAMLPVGMEQRLKRVEWEKKDTLVGSLRDEKQLEICIKERYYYVPKHMLEETSFPIHYVALYESRKMSNPGIRYYGEVTKVQTLRRKEISAPKHRKNDEELYYRFDVKEWKLLDRTIQIREKGVYYPHLINHFLLFHSQDSYELFYVQTKEQYRLLMELKRAASATLDVEKNKEKTLNFRGENTKDVLIVGDEIQVLDGKGKIYKTFPVVEFAKRPGRTFHSIKAALDITAI